MGLLPDPEVARLFRVTLMTLWRWTHHKDYAHLHFPKPVKIGTRNYRSEKALAEWHDRMVQQAVVPQKPFGIHANRNEEAAPTPKAHARQKTPRKKVAA